MIPFLFESGVVCPSVKEVTKGFIQISESLLEGNRRNLIKPCRFFLLLEQDQALRSPFIVQPLTMLVVGIGALAQGPVIDVAATPEGLRQDALLFIARIETILVGFLLLHVYSRACYAVRCQEWVAFIPPPAMGRVFPLLHG